MNKLEQSFADIRRRLNLTKIAVSYRGEEFPQHRFGATAWFGDSAPGQIPCAHGSGPTIDEALRKMSAALASKRSIALEGDEALYGEPEQEAA